MSSIEELKAQLEAEKARHAKAALSEEEQEQLKLIAQLAEAKAERLAAEKAQRALRGIALEGEARKVASGKYLVKFYDLARHWPDIEPEKLPGEGILILRSPPTMPVDVLGQFYREVEAKEKSQPDCYIDLVCACVVYPDVSKHDVGMAFRNFLESSIAKASAASIGDEAIALGGLLVKQTKRGRG